MKNQSRANALSERYLIRVVGPHFRLYISLAIGLVVGLISSHFGIKSALTQAIVGYDAGAIIYIVWALTIMSKSALEDIRQRALKHDDGKVVVLVLSVVALVFSTCAIFAELGAVKHLQGSEKYGSVALALITIVASWFFTAIVFALHYAHDYYFRIQRGKNGGLIFLPDGEDPAYWDFIYFALTLSATAQTADVTLSSSQMRRTCSLHSVLAFSFNTAILALAVNMASGLL